MNANHNMLSGINTIKESQLNNKGFAFIDGLFKENGWHLIKNDFDWIIYTKAGHETDFFEIRIDKNNVFLSIPIKNSSYQFRTTFKDYFQASEYLEMRFRDFCGLNN